MLMQSRYLQASKFPFFTDSFDKSPNGNIELRSVTDDAKNPMEEQTGARTPSASG
jgi:hypothetical protein